jgi:hypothetical protein
LTFSATDYTPGSQLQYLITSGNYWGWQGCDVCSDLCKDELKGNETMYKFNMIPKNTFGELFVPIVMKVADPYFRIVEHDDGYNVTLYQSGEWVQSSVLLDRWILREIEVENKSYPLITSMKTRGGDGGIARGYVTFIPYSLTTPPAEFLPDEKESNGAFISFFRRTILSVTEN